MARSGSTPESLADLDSVSNVLLLGASDDCGVGECCASLLGGTSPDELGLIGVTFSLTPDRWLAECTAALPAVPRRMAVVCVGEQARSTTGTSGSRSELTLPHSGGTCSVRSVASPGNLTALGVRITESLDEVIAVEEVSEVSLCFRSITPLLLDAGPPMVFQFLQVLTGKTTAEGVRAHFHLQRGVHDDTEIARLEVLFDATASVADGRITGVG